MNARRLSLLAAVAALPVHSAVAQGPPPPAASAPAAAAPAAAAPAAKTAESVFGMTLTVSGNERDTLGMLVGVITPGGPADRAGIAEGTRVAEINGTPLRVPPARVGDRAVADSARMRLARIIAALKPGSEVSVRTFHSGRYSTVSMRAPGTPEPGSEVAYAAPVTAAGIAAGTAATAAQADAVAMPSLTGVLAAMSEIESQLHQLALAGGPAAFGDSLAQAEQEVGDLRLRLRAVESKQRRHPTGASAGAGATGGSIPGIRLGDVDKELATYYGKGSENGVLVLEAATSWAPLRAGDVLLTVNGEPASEKNLGAEVGAGRPVRIDLLRKRKPLSVVVTPRG